MEPIFGLCECGCGRATAIAKQTRGARGSVKGQHFRFMPGHRAHGSKNALRHGMKGTPEYAAYQGAKFRCTNPNGNRWLRYGGRGIRFLFTSFEQFFAELGSRPSPEHSVDRWPNNDGNYEPGNVRWATKSEQRRNQAIVNG